MDALRSFLDFYDYICQNNCGHILGWGVLAESVWRVIVLVANGLGAAVVVVAF